jgi:histidinol dehydrogenase
MSAASEVLLIVPARGRAFDRRLALLEARGEQASGKVEQAVRQIVDGVRRRGDAALFAYTKRFDGVALTARTVEVPKREMAAAADALPGPVRSALRLAARRIAAFHRHQRQESWSFRDATGARLGQKVTPLDRVGVYVPGGTAAYPSSILMNVVPAKVAGVGEVVGVTPPGRAETAVLAAAHIAGIDRLFRIGGAQAVAALAYGTRTIPRVDKICGPGNIWVATAKRLVFGAVDIDMIAGPSEVLIVADAQATPRFRCRRSALARPSTIRSQAAILVTPVGRARRASGARAGDAARRAVAERDRAARARALRHRVRDADARRRDGAREPSRARALGARGTESRTLASDDPPRGCHLSRRARTGAVRRLSRRSEPRPADGRERALLVPARGLRLREALEHHRRRAAHAGEARSGGRASRPCRGLDAHARAIELRLEGNTRRLAGSRPVSRRRRAPSR